MCKEKKNCSMFMCHDNDNWSFDRLWGTKD